MTERTTRSLTLAADPVARLREIHDLDNPATASPSASMEQPNGSSDTAQQRSIAAAVERGNATTPKPAQLRPKELDNTATQQHGNAYTKERTHTSAHMRGSDSTSVRSNEEARQSENPVREAMRQMLRAPYSDDLSRGPATATTIRIPTEIWERLDMAARLQELTKQDIIAEALKQCLKKIGRGEV